MMTNEERAALCALNKIFGYHPQWALKLMEMSGSALQLFLNPPPAKGPQAKLVEQLHTASLDWGAQELERCTRQGFRFIAMGEDDYPTPLLECPDPPLGIYLNGGSNATEIFALRPMIGIVGTRDVSSYGKSWCERIVEALAAARTPVCIVSGLAMGVDGTAHRTALSCGLPTVGVMATGIDSIYPWQHERLAVDIVHTPGSALVTDYPIGTQPVALNFVRRNRIIAGLVQGVIVIESRTKGGSLMTAKYAVDYNREVFALPGRVDDARSAGCNSLIHEHMAEIISTPEVLVEQLGLGPGRRERRESLPRLVESRYGAGSVPVQLALAIRAQRGQQAEALARSLSLPYDQVLVACNQLEMDGFVTSDLLQCYAIASKYA